MHLQWNCCIELIELSSTHSYTWLAHSCSDQWDRCWFPLLDHCELSILWCASWPTLCLFFCALKFKRSRGQEMAIICSYHVPIMFPSCLFSQQEDQRAGLIPCLPSHDQCAQAPEKNQSYTCHQLPVFAVIALLRAMKTDARKGWQQTLKSCRGRYVT